MARTIEFSIEEGNIISFDADVVALKYAQNFYGVDSLVATALNEVGIPYKDISPSIGASVYIKTKEVIKSPYVLFVGVPPLYVLGYQDIRMLAENVLETLSQKNTSMRHLAMTIHGPGFALDEVEALLAQFTGYLQAIQNGKIPPAIERISIVERNQSRVERLRYGFEKNIAGMKNVSKVKNRWAYRLEVPKEFEYSSEIFFRNSSFNEKTVIKSEEKPHAFVAMPFRKDMEDIFYYGIQRAAHANDLLCERIDQVAFAGDILDRVKKKIETATVVIAELSDANPNVYLEVGYAWGKNVPTVLLVKKTDELRFDVRGQRCLKYEIIKDLEETLTKELAGLLDN